ncbi:FKBP-type peptidyl-prolyl cis-trans isomerase [Halobaculum litoreum]|uniref:FKBP-type peptidyl-prolyl cis-trans isomerase n=1 Tax=Halobaculum litoreum TaxID=3031998 RepID=UPI0024C29345|nr:FKBP-type peptidyl-prolyl cis-trans isomerase [Halobaculum sp. DT92]
MTATAEPGRIAIVHLTGRLADGDDAGAVFETTDVDVALAEGVYHDHRDFAPLEFRVGEGHVLPGVDEAVRGMAPGETETVVLDPADAYGARDDDAVVAVDRDALEARSDTTAAVDDLVRSERGDVGWVVAVDDAEAVVDFNHELAGRRVAFEIRVLEVHAADDTHADTGDRGEVA